jgi:hypothetical protein
MLLEVGLLKTYSEAKLRAPQLAVTRVDLRTVVLAYVTSRKICVM